MTTHILQGFATVADPNQAGTPVTEILQVELRIVMPDGSNTFSYSVTSNTGDLPQVEVNAPAELLAINGHSLDALDAAANSFETYIGQITHSGGQVTQVMAMELEENDSELQFIFELGGDPLPDVTTVADYDTLDGSITAAGAIPAGSSLAAGRSIAFTSLPNRTTLSDNFVTGTGGDDDLSGTTGNDVYFPQGNAGYDVLHGSVGDDIYDFSASTPGDFYEVHYDGLGAPIALNIDVDSGQSTVDKGANGTDTWVDAFHAMDYDNGDGIMVTGTAGNDTFSVAMGDGSSWFGIAAGGGNDTFDIAGGGTVRIQFNWDGNSGATAGANVNLATGTVSNDGFGGSDTISVTSDAVRVEIRGTDHDDTILGSDRNERFILEQGNDSLDAGGGWDMLRYDRAGVGAVTVDLAAGTATGTWDGNAFSHDIGGVEEVRGSRDGSDHITGDAEVNVLNGGGGNDTLIGGGADDTLYGGAGDDHLDGGDGMADTAAFAMNRSDATITFGAVGDATVTSSEGTDVITNVEYLNFWDETVDLTISRAATPGDDNLVGSAADDIIAGLGGRDAITGNGGSDRLYGEDFYAGYDAATSAQVYRLYQATLGREPDGDGHRDWLQRIVHGEIDLDGAAAGFVGSREFQNVYGALDDGDFVELLYQNVLGRASDPGGKQSWLDQLAGGASRAEVVTGFSESREFINNTAADAAGFTNGHTPQFWSDEVYRVYLATLNREPDLAGFTDWVGRLGSGTPLETAVAGFVGSREFQNTYGALDDSDFVELLYQNVLGRASDPGGKQSWLDQLAGGASRESVVLGFSESREFVNNTAGPLASWMRDWGNDDTIEPGTGNSVLAGGTGADTFMFDSSAPGSHTVLDPEPWDTFIFRNFGYQTWDELRSHMTESDGDVVFSDQGVTVTLADIQLSEIGDQMLNYW